MRLFIRSLQGAGVFLVLAPVVECFFPTGADFLYKSARWILGRFEKRVFRFVFVAGIFVLTVLLGLQWTHFLPIVSDEHAYRFQAQTLAGGKLWAPVHPLMEFFRAEQTLISDGKWFGKYPFGWPLFLAFGFGLRAPWLVNPLLGVFLLFVTYFLALRVTGERLAAAVALILVSISPFFLLHAVSWFPHVASALCMGGMLWAAVVAQDEQNMFLAWLAGCLLGLGLVIRPQDVLAVGLPFIIFLLSRKRAGGHRIVVRMFPGVLCFILLTAVYNALLMGDPFTFPYLAYNPLERLGLGRGNLFGTALRRSLFYLVRLHLWVFPYALVFLFALIRVRKHWSERMLGWCLIGVAGVPFLYFHEGGIAYGPRYYFAGIIPFSILAGHGILLAFRRLSGETWKRQLTVFLLGCLLLNVAYLFNHSKSVRDWIQPHALSRTVRQRHLTDALIFISIKSSLASKRTVLSNEPFLESSVLYAVDLGAENIKLINFYPDKKPYLAVFDEEERRWRLERLMEEGDIHSFISSER